MVAVVNVPPETTMFKTILVPLDGSVLAEQALGTAAMLARASHASVDLATVIEPMPFGGFDAAPWNDHEWAARQQYVESTAAELGSGASIAATGIVLRGAAIEKLREREHAIDADLVVMTSHGRSGVSRAWLGSTADAMIRHSDAPVLVLRPEPQAMHPSLVHRSFAHILVPLDGSALSTDIVPSATELARLSGARITLLRTVTPMPLISTFEPNLPFAYSAMIPDETATNHLAEVVRTELGQLAARLHAETGLTIDTTVVVNEYTARAIVDYAKANDVDLIAMSTHGRGPSRLLLGSVADKVLRSSGLAVMMHRPIGTSETTELLSKQSVCEQLPALGAT
jgi:nucleotide-binding universal stress UspA family protein